MKPFAVDCDPSCTSHVKDPKACCDVCAAWCITVHSFGYGCIMAYGSTPYVGMTPKKNGGHIKSAQMTCSKCPP